MLTWKEVTEAAPPTPVWDITHRELCISKMQSITTCWDLPSLKNVSFLLETFPTETVTMIYPYVGMLIAFPVFYRSFASLSDDRFFQNLFRRTIDHLESRVFSLRDLWFCPHNRKIVICGIALTSGFAGFRFMTHPKIALEAIEALEEVIKEEPIPVDHLVRFRFTGLQVLIFRRLKSILGAFCTAACEYFSHGRKSSFIHLLNRATNLSRFSLGYSSGLKVSKVPKE